MSKVCVYVDGGNLHNRLKESGRSMYPTTAGLHKLATELCTVVPDDNGVVLGGTLVQIMYCNAPIKVPAGKTNHLQVFMNRLSAAGGFRVLLGSRKDSPQRCPHKDCLQEIVNCPVCQKAIRRRTVEKGVDLQIAAECVADAAQNVCDIALVFTHDEDYCQLARVLKERFGKEMKVAYLMTRRSHRPGTLIRATRSGSGLAIDKAPCFKIEFPVWGKGS